MNRDIAILIYSRGREDLLTRLVDDMDRFYMPALKAGGMSACAFIYAQNYSRAYLDGLKQRFAPAIAAGRLILFEAKRPHSCIGEVFAAATEALHAHVDYRLAMLMDDDSLYRAEPVVDDNLRAAARCFLDHADRAYSIKLGQSRSLEYWPFIDHRGPIMPFKEKMLWVSRGVMEEALAFEEFATLSVGEDVVLAALAWKGGAERCFGVFGIATFLHLGFEPDQEVIAPTTTGGYGELMGYDESKNPDPELGKYGAAFRSGIVPYRVMSDVFVGPEHPHHTISGIRPEAVERYGVPSYNRVQR
ncbi:MAG: hypothetical protein ACRDBL_07755 [Rhabdaerophilum sp.]